MTKFLAVYTGTTPPEGQAQPLSQDRIAEGMAAWGDWMTRNATRIFDTGGPLGVTKRVSAGGVADTHNNLSGYVVIEAQSHGRVYEQGWAFYATTFCLFVVFAFPGFAWAYLWRPARRMPEGGA